MLFSELKQVVGFKSYIVSQDQELSHLLIDSRKLIIHRGAVFVAIRGIRNDGHKFLKNVYEAGIRNFIIEEHSGFDLEILKDANVVICENSLSFLQELVKEHRKKFTLPVLAITGSNAKTTIKEYLGQMLESEYDLVKSPKSYNSQIGVPLSVWQIQNHHNLAIFEAGISTVDEMEILEKIIQPTIGIFTNIGTAHDEGFDSLQTKIKEKLRLFKHVEKLIYRSDYELLTKEIEQQQIPSISWSLNKNNADVSVHKLADSMFEFTFLNKKYALQIPFTDAASVENIIHCVVFMLYLDFDANHMNNLIRKVRNVSMRLELKQGINNCYIIDDTYNNDLAGLQIALDFVEQQNMRSRKVLILSDLVQSGTDYENTCLQIATKLKDHAIDTFIGIGEKLSLFKNIFPANSQFYTDTQSFIDTNTYVFNNELILIKGSRSFEFEHIVEKLQQKTHGTVLEINLEALTHNLNFFRSKLNSSVKIMAMVKAFAYGSGSYEVAHLMQFQGVDYLGVAYTNEAIDLRNNGITLPIMVLNTSRENFDALIEYNLEPEVYSMEILQEWVQYLSTRPRVEVSVHLDIDTGMRRLGFEPDELLQLVGILKQNPQIKIASVYSHLVGADEDTHESFTHNQISIFKEFALQFEQLYGVKVLKHICNSAGIVAHPEAHLDMVRLGVGLYGVEATQKEQHKLRAVSTLKTVIAQIKHIKKGETVGYGRRGVALEDTSIATINIGYADGYSRAFSRGVGKVWINGYTAKIMGNICMDMCMIDITNLPVHVGDVVEIFGENLSIIELATSIQTIPYEILTNVSERVKRVFYIS
ncbi:MAG: bifunctional UDP-N-acetylmuramoyl-tripeptide:D-alanyl-D-alanine ligase/alanine racemase [Cytophagales bacterium]